METKICTKCRVEYTDVDANFRLYKGKLYSSCRICEAEARRKWNSENPIKRKEFNKKYYEVNSDKWRTIWRKSPEELVRRSKVKNRRPYSYEKEKERRENDPEFKLKGNLRKRVRDALNGFSKSKNTMELTGCSIEFLKQHLENQFKENMSWENYGRKAGLRCWHVDHIKACDKFDLSDPQQQKDCFNWQNLQPLWEDENLRKHTN